MRHILRSRIPALAAAAFVAGAGSALAADPKGVWLDDTGAGAIEIKDCSGKLCGHLVWLRDSANYKNCGKQILGDAKSVGNDTWDNGWIYSPEKKQRFDLELKSLSKDKLQVMGYAGVKFLSKTMVWTRAPASLTRCDPAKAEAPAETKAATATAANPPPGETGGEDAPPPAADSNKPAPDGKDSAPSKSEQVARADRDDDADEKPKERAEDRDDDGEAGGAKPCKLEVPYVTLTFPCKD